MDLAEQDTVIFFGDVDDTVARTALAFDRHAQLLDHTNYRQFLQSPDLNSTAWYSSLGDLPTDLELVYNILSRANRVVYCAPERWSDNRTVDCTDPCISIQGLTEVVLCMLPASIRVENLQPITADPVQLVDRRQSDNAQIWNVGCSVTYGSFIAKHERYGQLLAQRLGMSCSFLAIPGRSIHWAADQILRSDIRNGDLVVWGLTSPERLMYVHEHRLLNGVTPVSYDRFDEYKNIVHPENLSSHDNLYKQYYAVQQVCNFCEKIGANLILINLLYGNHFIQRAFRRHKSYVHVPYRMRAHSFLTEFLDLASDNEHPGPLQHQQYFQLIYDHILHNPTLSKIYLTSQTD